MIDDGRSIEVIQDAWISSSPISRWPTLVSNEVGDHMRVSDPIDADGSSWRAQKITRLFGGPLAEQILAIPIFVYPS